MQLYLIPVDEDRPIDSMDGNYRTAWGGWRKPKSASEVTRKR